ncbi:MAG: hypothetical protein EPO32_02255 [Anaerolineae bacterium]|nr:MAG: hypothetical protein EPO32_02255 [Anaerolineae bacterium]
MDDKTITKIAKNVERSFPGVSWQTPRVQHNPAAQAKNRTASNTYLLIFSGSAEQGDGRSIPRQVRVVANDKGQILRMSTSH